MNKKVAHPWHRVLIKQHDLLNIVKKIVKIVIKKKKGKKTLWIIKIILEMSETLYLINSKTDNTVPQIFSKIF